MDHATCTICSDYLTLDNCHVLPCGHTFHYVCIVTWKEHSPTCPQCRVRFKDPKKVFFDVNTKEDDAQVDSAALKNQVTDLNMKMNEKERSLEIMKEQSKVIVKDNNKKAKEIQELNLQLQNSSNMCEALQRQLSYIEKFKVDAKKYREESSNLQQKLFALKNIQECVDGHKDDVDEMLKNFGHTPEAMTQIATAYSILKKEFDVLKGSKRKIDSERKSLLQQLHKLSQENYTCITKLKETETVINNLTEKNKSLEDKVNKLQQSFASASPRSNALKRLLRESPAPLELKRLCMMENMTEEEIGNMNGDCSLILIDSPQNSHASKSTCESGCDLDNEGFDEGIDEETKRIANEFGLNYVGTTSLSNIRPPLKDKKNTSYRLSVPLQKPSASSNSTSSSSLPHLKKGYNGFGGQSKVLVIPKKTSTFGKLVSKTTTKKTIKIPKNNSKISHLFSSKSQTANKNAPRLPNFDVTLKTP